MQSCSAGAGNSTPLCCENVKNKGITDSNILWHVLLAPYLLYCAVEWAVELSYVVEQSRPSRKTCAQTQSLLGKGATMCF